MNLKKNIYLHANSTTQRCPQERMKIFLIEDFFELRISPRIFEKIRKGPNGINTAWRKLIHVENLKSKSRGTVPLNQQIL
jgi:hypothetical protein